MCVSVNSCSIGIQKNSFFGSYVVLVGLILLLCSSLWAAPVIYPAPSGAPQASRYSMTVNGSTVFVYNAGIADPRNCSYAYFDLPAGETAQIVVTVPSGFNSAKVRPVSAKITPTTSGNTISFSVSKPQKLAITTNGSYTNPFFIFVNPIEVNPPSQSSAKYYYGPGIHSIGAITLNSNETVYIAGGAMVRGTFSTNGVRNVTIRGRGILDCSTNSSSLMRFNSTTKITLEGFIAVDHPQMNWAITFRSCDSVFADNTKEMYGDGWSADAFNMVNTQHCWITNCFMNTYDDCLCIKAMGTSRRQTKDIHASGCFLWPTWAHGIQIGPELLTDSIKDMTFTNMDIVYVADVGSMNLCTTYDYYGALGICNTDDAIVANIRYDDIRIEIGNSCPRLLNCRVATGQWGTAPTRGWIKDIYFKDINLINEEGHSWDAYMHGFDNSHLVENVTFENLVILGNTITSASGAKLDTAKVKNLRFIGSAIPYTVTASAGSNGTISPSGSVSVGGGSSQTFTISPSSGYMVSSVLVDGVSVGAVSSYSFTNITANHSIAVTFTAITTAPPAPTLISPTNGATGQSLFPTLRWASSNGAATYRCQVSIASSFTTTIVDDASLTATSKSLNGLALNTTYYWRVNATNSFGAGSWSPTWNFITTPYPKLTGTVIGTTGSYNSNGYTRDKAMDGDSSTYFDSPEPGTNAWVGLDLGSAVQITKVRYFPRAAWESRMTGAKIQGSNVADFSSGVVDLYTITTQPLLGWTEVAITNTTAFRYVRILLAGPSYGNVAEIEFYGSGSTGIKGNNKNPRALMLESGEAFRMTSTTALCASAEPFVLSVFNSQGKQVYVCKGNGYTLMDLSSIKTGIYSVQFKTSTNIINKSWIKIQ